MREIARFRRCKVNKTTTLLLIAIISCFAAREAINCRGKPIHIAAAADSNHRRGLLALMNSIYRNTMCPKSIVFHLFDSSPLPSFPKATIIQHTPHHKSKLLRFVNQQYDELQFPRGNLKASENYVRYLLADILNDVQACWWLDADTIVQGDLYQLTRKLDIYYARSNAILAGIPRKRKGFTVEAFLRLKSLGIAVQYPAVTFNAGILYLNLDSWRKKNVTSTLAAIASANEHEALWNDSGSQPPLQLAVGDDFDPVPATLVDRLGYKPGITVSDAAMFLHWNGKHKPWLPSGKYASYWDVYAMEEPTTRG